MTWLVPSFLAIMTGSAILFAVFLYLWVREHEPWLGMWASAWAIYTIRFGVDLISVTYASDPTWFTALSNVLVLVTGALLLEGSYSLSGGRRFPWHRWLGLGIAVWTIASAGLGLPDVYANGPAWCFRGIASIAAGILWYREVGSEGIWAKATGFSLVAWGVHNLDYPFLRGVVWFAPIGFLIGAVFEFVIAFGALITHYERTRGALQSSEQRYTSLFEGSSSVMMLVDPATAAIVDANDAAAAYYGWTRDQMLRMQITDINTLTPEQVIAEMAKVTAGDRTYFMFRHRHADGAISEVEVYTGPIMLGGRQLLYSIVHDISQRVAAENALRESEARYSNLFRRSHSAMLLVDPDGARVVDANAAAEALYGYPIDEMKRMRVMDLADDTPQAIDDQIADAIRQSAQIGYFRHRRADGTIFDVEINATPIVFEGKTLLYTIINDITARLEAQRELEEYQNHLQILVDERTHELTEANTALEAATRAKDEFMTSMSHELRTPLNSVIGFSDMLTRELPGPINEEQRRQIDMIGRSGRHLLSIVNDILDLARIESGSVDVRRAPVDAGALVARLLEGVRPLAERGEVTLLSAVDDGLELYTDERLLEQILWNLVGNAVRFTAGGTVHVDATGIDGGVSFSVCDNGEGMTAEQLEHAFEKFTSYRGRQEDGGGTGLGLSISSRLAEYLGGTLHAQSTYGEGSRFVVDLPVSAPMDPPAVDNRE